MAPCPIFAVMVYLPTLSRSIPPAPARRAGIISWPQTAPRPQAAALPAPPPFALNCCVHEQGPDLPRTGRPAHAQPALRGLPEGGRPPRGGGRRLGPSRARGPGVGRGVRPALRQLRGGPPGVLPALAPRATPPPGPRRSH